MKISQQKIIALNPNTLKDEQFRVDSNLWKYPVLLLGRISGVALSRRDNDNFIYHWLSEDDGHWFLSQNTGLNTGWIEDQERVLQLLKEYLQSNHCKNDFDIKVEL